VEDDGPFAIDTGVAYPARVLNYLAGGDGNFAADRQLAEDLGDALPGGIGTARAVVRSLGAFMGRAVRYLTGEVGIGQFLIVGAAIPPARNVHEVAQLAAPGARFVYVGDDPVVLAHAHSLLSGAAAGVAAYVDGSLSDPEAILRRAGETLDFTRPVAVMLLTTLNFVPDADDPDGIVARLRAAVPSGSCLTIAHSSFDFGAEGMTEAAERLNKAIRQPFVVRSRTEIAGFFDGLDMAEPGLVQIDRWRPDESRPVPPTGRPTPIYVGVGRKP
jgi:hypothetical protein